MRFIGTHWFDEPKTVLVERGLLCPHCQVELTAIIGVPFMRCDNCGGPLVHEDEKREVVDTPIGPLLVEKL